MKDAYYFSHDSNARNDQRLMKVRMKYGMEGYGIYFGIIEILREQAEYTLAFNDLESISFDLRVDLEKIEDVVSNYDLFVIDGHSMFYSKSLKKRMEKLDLIKQKRVNAGRIGGKRKASDKHLLSKESITKYKKIKQIKDINKRYDDFEDDVKSYQSLFDEDTINDFISYWTEPNKSNTKMKYEMQPTWDTKRRIQRWIGNDFGNNKSNGISNFQKDANGKFWIGYCSKCNVSDFYDDLGIKQDSRCCKSKILPERKLEAIKN